MLKSLICSLVLAVASVASMAQGSVGSQEVSPGESRAVRAVVEAQLKALAANQPAQAFSYASPAIRKQFQDATLFMEMVRRTYPMLISPASISFFRPAGGEGVIVQPVQFRDQGGKLWRAIYELQSQPDRSWRINGCAVSPGEAASTT